MDGSNQWYMAIGGHQVGPVSQQEIFTNLQNGSIDAETLVFTAGMAQWQKVKDVPAFAAYVKNPAAASAGPGAGAPFTPPPAPGRRAHDIDFEIHGGEMQYVEVELDPGEGAIAEAGSMMYMTQGIQMDTIFGDGSQQQSSGLMGALMGAGKRQLTGESLFTTLYSTPSSSVPQGSVHRPQAQTSSPHSASVSQAPSQWVWLSEASGPWLLAQAIRKQDNRHRPARRIEFLPILHVA